MFLLIGHGFEQHILILFVQPRAVGEDVNLARALVRADEGVRPHAADDVHAQLGVLVVAHGEDVGVNVREHLAAMRAGQAGLVRTGTLQRGSGVMRRGVPVARSREDECVAQRAAARGGAETRGGIRFCKGRQLHALLRTI